MPPLRTLTPESLEDLCFFELFDYLQREVNLCINVRRYENTSLLLRRRGINSDTMLYELKGYLDVLPPLLNEMIRQRIVSKILKTYSKTLYDNPPAVLKFLDIILCKEVKTVELNDQNLRYDSEIWPILLKRCTGLERFALVPKMLGPCGAGALQPLLCRLCLNCPQLTELVLKDSVKGSDTMAFIGKTCHRLRLLDITGSRVVCSDLIRLCVRSPHRALQDFTANSTEQNVYDYDLNPLCQTLEIVLLENTRVKIKGGVFVMKAMPNLESLGNFLYTAAALKKIYGLRGKPKPCFKLKKAFYRGPSTAKLQVLANCCPLLESLYFGSNEVRRICPRILSTFKMLRSLALENIYHTDLMEALKYTPHLIELEVYSSVDFGIVGQFCPLLEKLKVGKEPLRTVTLPSDDTKLYSRLQDLKITVPISLECGALFMSRATQLRNVEITKIRDVTDGLFEEWLRLNPLEHLESLMLRYVELTRDSVNLLLLRCPRLTRLGELGGWDIRSWECRRLKDLILRENYALHLVLYTRTSLNIGDIISDNVNSEESGMEWD